MWKMITKSGHRFPGHASFQSMCKFVTFNWIIRMVFTQKEITQDFQYFSPKMCFIFASTPVLYLCEMDLAV